MEKLTMVRHEVVIIIVMPFKEEGDITSRSVGCSLSMRAGLVTSPFEAMETMSPALWPILRRETRDHLRASMRVGGLGWKTSSINVNHCKYR